MLAVSVFGSASCDQVLILDMRETCRLTRISNPAITAAAASFTGAEASLRRYRAAALPSIEIKSNYGYIDKATLFAGTPVLETNTLINSIELTQPIYTGGRVSSAIAAAQYGLSASGAAGSAVEAQTVARAAAAYFAARQTCGAVSIAEASVKSLEESYRVAGKLFESGVVTRSDVLRAEVALTAAREQLIKAANDLGVALAALRSAIGLPQSTPIELAPTGVETVADNIDHLAALTRDELIAASYALKAASKNLDATRASAKPTLGMVINFENQPVGSQFPRLTNTVLVGLQAKFSVFNGGQTRAQVDEAAAEVAKAQAELGGITQALDFELQAARLGVASARARVEAIKSQVESAEESYRVVETGYREGINVLTDVLSVESMLTAARVSRVAADYDLKIAELRLLLALGQTGRLTE